MGISERGVSLMPNNIVKTKADEVKWEKAKKQAATQYDEGTPKFFALVNYIFHKMKGDKK